MDTLASLELALTATRPGASRALAGQPKQDRRAALHDLLDRLPLDQAHTVRRQAADLADRGVSAILRGDPGYPDLLDQIKDAPPILFLYGQQNILDLPSIGVCGSRNVSDHGLRAATLCGETATSLGLVSTSGYARGVDTATHLAALRSGGSTIVVLPEGIDHFRVKREIREAWDPSRTLVISQFAPGQTWSAGGAMSRNTVILGLSMALIVVEAGDKGGTLAAGEKALGVGRRVLALEFTDMPPGNQLLIERGAISVSDREELTVFLDELRHVAELPESSANRPYPRISARARHKHETLAYAKGLQGNAPHS